MTWITSLDRLAGAINSVHVLLANANGMSETQELLRIIKVWEEAGEVAQAAIGTHGQNPRKGVTHTREDVRAELLDVALTALVAAEGMKTGAVRDMAAQLEMNIDRLEEAVNDGAQGRTSDN